MTEHAANLAPRSLGKQGPNRDQTGFDQAQAFAFLESTAAKWPKSNRLDVLVLRALALLSSRDPPRAKAGFSSFEIAQVVGEIRGTPWSSQDDKDKVSADVRKQWRVLLGTWESKKVGVQQSFHDQGFPCVPLLDKTEGGGTGNMSLYRINWAEPDADSLGLPLTANAEIPGTDVYALRYVCEDIEDAGWLTRVFARDFVLSGWRRWLMVVVVAVPLLATLALFIVAMLGLIQWSQVGTANVLGGVAAFAIVLVASWIIIGPILRVVDRRVVLAPLWMQDDHDSRLLEHRNPPRYTVKSIKAVRYTSACPICGGRVMAKSGELEFWGRIVGRCQQAPVEHVYSFDHVTRSGKLLR